MCRVACPLLPGFPPPLLASIYTLSALRFTVMVLSGSLLWRRVFAMWSPFRVESVLVLDRSDGFSPTFLVFGWCRHDEVTLTSRVVSALVRCADSSHTFPRGWCRAFTMGTPVSCRVAYFCALDRYEGCFCPSILSCFAMGHPTGRVWFFSHSIVTKSSLDIWSVFLQDGVTLLGSESNVLISSEGIPTFVLLGAFFFPARPLGGFLSSFSRPVSSAAGRVPHSVVIASGKDCVCIPLANEGVGLGPVASRPPLTDRSASAASSTPGDSPGIPQCSWVLLDGCRPGWFR